MCANTQRDLDTLTVREYRNMLNKMFGKFGFQLLETDEPNIAWYPDNALVARVGPKVSPHQVGLQDLLALAKLRGHFPTEVILWGVQADIFEPGLELNPPIAAQVEPLCAHVLEELARWGIRVEKK